MVLYVIGACYVIVPNVSGGTELLYAGFVVCGVFFPLCEIGCLVPVSQATEGGIGYEPFFVGRKEGFECFGFEGFFSCFRENGFDVCFFGEGYSFVVYFGKGVQLFFQFFVSLHRIGVFQCADFFDAEIVGMQCEYGVCVVGVGVYPCVCHCGVVDGEYLYDAHTGFCSPVDHFPQVDEVSDTEALFGAEGEYGYGYSCSFPSGKGVVQVHPGYDDAFVVGEQGYVDCAVVSGFPAYQGIV